MEYRNTRVWQVNNKLVVADTIEDAIQVYRVYADNHIDIKTIYAVSDNQTIPSYDALEADPDKENYEAIVLSGVANSIINWIDSKRGIGMLTSDTEMEIIGTAVKKFDWDIVFKYMKRVINYEGE